MKKSFLISIFLLLSACLQLSAQPQKIKDTTSYGVIVLYTDPVRVQVEIPTLKVNRFKTEEPIRIEYVPPARYLIRVSSQKKMLEYELDVQPYVESHLKLYLKKQRALLLGEIRFAPEIISNKPDDPDEIYTVVEEPPRFPGKENARISFLTSNIRYPDSALKNGIQGVVFIYFVVEKDGSLSGVKVLKGTGDGCDEEAVRVVKLMPKWIPGRQRGKPVRVSFILPIKFSMNNIK